MKPFLILQLRSLDGAADSEFEAFLKYGRLKASDVHQVRMEKESIADLDPEKYAGIIVGGGPSNVSDPVKDKPDFQQRFEKELDVLYQTIFEQDIPYLGVCYGLGSVVKYAGGRVSKERYSEEVGYTTVQLTEQGKQDPLLTGLPGAFKAFCGHKEACQYVPAGGELLAGSEACPVQMVRFGKNIYATQFHVELDADGIAGRIRYYKHHGYFEPEEADALIAKTKDVIAEVPQEILRRFVAHYRK
ncbi:MAG: glutamine amidotransferase [Cyclobacteriaceae bacterium]|nr:glutamine amidotransferase [Cyclobacteriaceae bacterium]